MGELDKREQDLLTPNAADLAPTDMPWTGTRRSPLILFETPYRQLIPYSMFDPEIANGNGLIFGTSGSGKSVLAQEILLMATRSNALVSILERGDSYLPLVDLMGGQMIEMSLDSNQTINPWDLPQNETEPGKNQIAFLKNLTRHMLGEHTPPDYDMDLLDSILLDAIRETYRRCGSRVANPIPLFSDLAAELAHWQDRDKNDKINQMARLSATKLRAWIEGGPYAQLFDQPTTIDLENPWLYFNIERLKDDPRLESAMSLLIAHAATHRGAGLNGRRSITMLDECWALLESPHLANAVVQLFRTARKRDASVWGISQTPEDFVGSQENPNPYGAGIMKNAMTKIIGKQPGDMTALREHVHLNETALNQIKSFGAPKKGQYAEFLIAMGEKAASTHAIRVVPSPMDLWIVTTYPRERQYRKWFLHTQQEAGLSLFQAYEELARRFPNGLSALARTARRTLRRSQGGICRMNCELQTNALSTSSNTSLPARHRMRKAMITSALAVGAVLAMPAAGHAGIFGVFDAIFGLIKGPIGEPLNEINTISQQTQNLYQQAMWPLAQLNQARGFVSNSITSYRGYMTSVFFQPFNSATLPGPQQLENVLHSRNAADLGSLTSSFHTNYGVIPTRQHGASTGPGDDGHRRCSRRREPEGHHRLRSGAGLDSPDGRCDGKPGRSQRARVYTFPHSTGTGRQSAEPGLHAEDAGRRAAPGSGLARARKHTDETPRPDHGKHR